MSFGENREEYNAYMAKYMKAWYARRRAVAIEKLASKCIRCGSIENLQFDHVNPATKLMAVSKMWTASEVRFQAELAKCQLLCEDCHKEKTLSEISVPHGGGVSGKKNCPCRPCKQIKAQYMKRYNRERR